MRCSHKPYSTFREQEQPEEKAELLPDKKGGMNEKEFSKKLGVQGSLYATNENSANSVGRQVAQKWTTKT